MTPYRNLNGNSSIDSYQISEDSIHVVFKSGRQRNYVYNHLTPGKMLVDQMKALAISGRGLNAFISTVVKTRYAEKW